MKRCPIHKKPGTWVYPCCFGAKGGAQTSAKKAISSRANLEKARAAKEYSAAVQRAREMRRRTGSGVVDN